ncbi:FkbM family methyltransferase [Leptospira yasudae]|uniref:FkbM family methyltransferase n=1 Tax=Leptospira yasudae TaxID=2202201 RepID=UPI001C4E99EE|nr:FkbM family methyltransferase [Leptospira yasudae]MBW0434122.1 FkbM family methyltransferase [Leptospira yasudae]
MKQIIKNILRFSVDVFISFLKKTSIGRFTIELILNKLMNDTAEVEHNGKIRFTTPNEINRFRVDTFSSKEPETLEWIDQIPLGATLWDIGANVGLYSIYAAKHKNAKVYSFEPSVFNLELLARNIHINGLSDRITIVPLALSDKLAVSKLNMTTMEWGGALSTFGETYGHDGKKIQILFEYNTLGLSMEDAVQKFKLPAPEYIKMDVDGIEHLILNGGKKILKNVKQILVEINEDFQAQADLTKKILSKSGLVLSKKKGSEISNTGSFKNTYNQIWTREKRKTKS